MVSDSARKAADTRTRIANYSISQNTWTKVNYNEEDPFDFNWACQEHYEAAWA